MAESYLDRNISGLQRLRAAVASLGEADMALDVGGGWTVAVVLAHMGFWDRYLVARWTRAAADRERVPPALPDIVADYVNDASLESWRALAPRIAAEQALAAAGAAQQFVASLDAGAAAQVVAEGRPSLVDRSLHWFAHLEQIEGALGR